jgi:hypothetical protein
MNEISTYKGNTKVISISVPAGYSGYTLTFIVDDTEYNDASILFTISGVTITNQIAIVNISATQNNIPERAYFYEAYIIKGALKYTIAKSTYTVQPSLI